MGKQQGANDYWALTEMVFTIEQNLLKPNLQ